MSHIAPVFLHNSLTRTLVPFEPLKEGEVRFYACGPTVYNFAHIGNLRTYICEDVIARSLSYAGYDVRHVMNVTDVGHLESDADEGDDKMALAAKREKKSVWDIAREYEDVFFSDCAALNIRRPTTVCRATEHIEEIIDFVKAIEEKGFSYTVDGNVYFSVRDFPDFGAMAHNTEYSAEHARVAADARKRDPRDFVLWFSNSKFENQIMQWDSPWGRGFPGWHIECSCMASQYLGERIDIHMGGIDHIPVHHTNEIAQSESRFGHKWVNYWMHCHFLIVDEGKMSKSKGEFLRLKTVVDHGYDPLHYRYFCLGAHYRRPLKFTWEALDGARTAYENYRNLVLGWKSEMSSTPSTVADDKVNPYWEKFRAALFQDFNAPQALSVLWEMARDTNLNVGEKYWLANDFDQVLALGVADFAETELEPELRELIELREQARVRRDWAESDALRDRLLAAGIAVKDSKQGTTWYRSAKNQT